MPTLSRPLGPGPLGHGPLGRGPRAALLVVAIVLPALTGVAACRSEQRYRVLAFLFEDIPQPGADVPPVPVVRSPRHPAPPTPTPTAAPPSAAQAGAGGLAVLATWDDVLRLLPKNAVGSPDWSTALEEKVIAPRPGVAPDAAAQDIFPLDVELRPKSDAAFTVTFSHQKHGEWLACPNCHTDLFAMQAGATTMAPAELHADRFCGSCHGKVAFEIVTGCPLCHLRNFPKDLNGRVDWNRALAQKLIAPRAGLSSTPAPQPILDLDVVLESPAQPTFKSIFSHAAHTQWLACANCHPQPFPMGGRMEGVAPLDLHARRYCGACHGKVSFGIASACGPCHPALQKARQHQEVFDLDTEIAVKSQSSSETVFSHKTHRFVECASCHIDLFETAPGTTKVRMADIYTGSYCTVCHGRVTSDLTVQCQRCHARDTL